MDKFCYNCMMPVNSEKCGHCGYIQTNKTSAHHLKPGTILNGRYYIGKAIGQGGFGLTYIARDLNLDMIIAVKEFFPNGYVNRNSNVSSVVEIAGEKNIEFFNSGKKRFIREAKLLAKFSENNNIVDIRDYFEENNTGYIVMEFVRGETLTKYLNKNGKFSTDEILDRMIPLFYSLDTIHKSGLIHRDISPDNIMLMSDGSLKLMDFGSARYINFWDNHTMSIMFKPGYAPEEQYRQKGSQGPWTDVYAICATIYKCVTKSTPDDSMERAFKDNMKKPSELGADISEKVEEVLLKGMAVYKEDRYQTMGELAQAFINASGKDYKAYTEIVDTEITEPTDIENDKTVFYSENEDDKTEYYTETVTPEIKDEVIQPTPEKKIKKSRKKLYITIALLIISAVISGIFAYERSTYRKVPNLTGIQLSKAESIIKKNNLLLKSSYKYSDTVKKGLVISQSPLKDTSVKMGTAVKIAVSKGKLVAVTDLKAMNIEKAEKLLKDKNLYIKVTKTKYSKKYKKNCIISQSPPKNSSLPENSTVEVVLSKGEKKYAVPNLVGKNYNAIKKSLKKFKVKTTFEYSDKDENIILSQTPKPGKKLKRGSKVNLIISKGAMPTTAATQPRVHSTTPAATQKPNNRSFGGLTLS